MCLIVSKKTKIKEAKKDMVVYKLFFKEKTFDGLLQSPYFYSKYEFNKIYTEIIKITDDYSHFDNVTSDAYYNISRNFLTSYGEGLHSILTIDRLKKVSNLFDKVAYECIIPKGSLYIIDKTDLVVSNQIIVTEKQILI